MNKSQKTIFIISIIISLLIGFYFGRKTINIENNKIEIKYVNGDTIYDSIPYPVPYEIIKPIDTLNIIKKCVKDGIYSELFPEKVITEYVTFTSDDTLAIINDWATKKNYSEIIFDNDTIGKCTVNTSVQYNRLSFISYEYLPINKVITISQNKGKMFSPFIGAGITYNNNKDFGSKEIHPSFNVGFFLKEKYGINLTYERMLNENNNLYGLSFLYKF